MAAELAVSTPQDELNAIFQAQKAAFENERHRRLDDRKADLKKIKPFWTNGYMHGPFPI